MSVCLGMCAQFPKSELVVCTDGVANIGLGNLDDGEVFQIPFTPSLSCFIFNSFLFYFRPRKAKSFTEKLEKWPKNLRLEPTLFPLSVLRSIKGEIELLLLTLL